MPLYFVYDKSPTDGSIMSITKGEERKIFNNYCMAQVKQLYKNSKYKFNLIYILSTCLLCFSNWIIHKETGRYYDNNIRDVTYDYY